MNKNRVFFIVSFILLFSACRFEKILKSDDMYYKFDKAMEYYNEENFAKSAIVLEQISPIFRGTRKADTVNFYLAKSYFGQLDYILSGYHFSQFAKEYGNSPFAEEAQFMRAYCYYMESPRPSLDQTTTTNAINAFQLFVIKFPKSKRIIDCHGYIIEMKNKLVQKSYNSAKLYFDLSEYKASIVALKVSLNEFPDTKFREELMFLTLKSHFLLAEHSIISKQKERYQVTVDEYFSFISEFSESQYAKEAQDIYSKSQSILKN